MSEPFIGEIRAASFGFPPKGWALCNGQVLPINQNQALFSLLGTQYGGDGRTTFALPNLQGQTPLHMGQDPAGASYVIGQRGGEATHTLTVAELPAHTHPASAAAAGTTGSPQGAVWAAGTKPAYAALPNTAMAPNALSSTGGSQPHENRQPYLVVNHIIALQGIFPSQN
ncbi:MAG: phage Tail Collar domain protein [Marmoricola sp.]|nr:phage Tail Collar domain protein [Marmoricola sp.]